MEFSKELSCSQLFKMASKCGQPKRSKNSSGMKIFVKNTFNIKKDSFIYAYFSIIKKE